MASRRYLMASQSCQVSDGPKDGLGRDGLGRVNNGPGKVSDGLKRGFETLDGIVLGHFWRIYYALGRFGMFWDVLRR